MIDINKFVKLRWGQTTDDLDIPVPEPIPVPDAPPRAILIESGPMMSTEDDVVLIWEEAP